MRSSTSSSEHYRAIPAGFGAGTWIVALTIALVLVWLIEQGVLARGQRPSVVDDPIWWAVHRHQVDGGRDIVAFVGTSRLALAYSPPDFQADAPGFRGVQLSINGTIALGVLEDLAADGDFRGLVVVDVAEWELTREGAFEAASPWVSRGRTLWRAPGALVNRFIATHVQSRLAVLAVGGRQFLASFLGARSWPPPTWAVTARDRSVRADYLGLATADALDERRKKGLASLPDAEPAPEVWVAAVRRVAASVARIQARGGKVVLVRMPMSGALAEAGDMRFPRGRFWDVLVENSGAIGLHYRDVPAWAEIECPDGMHIDQRDQATFTRTLVESLRERGLLVAP